MTNTEIKVGDLVRYDQGWSAVAYNPATFRALVVGGPRYSPPGSPGAGHKLFRVRWLRSGKEAELADRFLVKVKAYDRLPMTNTEIKVGDLVGWDDGEEVTRGLVVDGPFEGTHRGWSKDPADGYFRVRWLTGHLEGDTMECGARFLFLLSDLENKKQSA